jgi:5-methylcytosine-specific restriction enzyme B
MADENLISNIDLEKESELLAEIVSEESLPTDEIGLSGFYWKQARENVFTDAGVRIFQIAYAHKDQEYDQARFEIDKEYESLSPRLRKKGRETARHGGYFTTYIMFLEETGLMYRETNGDKVILRATPAGDQAAVLLGKLPTALRVIPYFIVELLSRYRFNNPLNKNPKNRLLAKETSESDIFPYWTLYKIIRASENRITKDELARFVFRMKRMSEIDDTIQRIKSFRKDQATGLSEEELERKYGQPLTGAIAQPKYFMGRAGFQVGVIKQDGDSYSLNPDYISFIDTLLANEPQFEELNEETWIRKYGDQITSVEPFYLPYEHSSGNELCESVVSDEDGVYINAKQLIDDQFSGILFVGPPGTGKTWYARQIALKLVGGDISLIREVQFHPSYQYEDFVEGYVPDGRGGFRLVDRHLLYICHSALQSNKTHVLIIDELSRTDPSRVMGEAMTYMESTLRGQPFFLPSGRRVTIPPNVVFFATMNPEDRSVDEIDAAMDRRWGKIFLAPDISIVNNFLKDNQMPAAERTLVIEFFKWVQQYYKIGHAFFRTVKDKRGLERLWENQLKFLFEKAFRYDADTLSEIQQKWQQLLASIGNQPDGNTTSSD